MALRLKSPKPRPIYVDPDAKPVYRGIPRTQRRKEDREDAKRRKRTLMRPGSLDEVNPASMLSDETKRDIEAGRVQFSWELVPERLPVHSKVPARNRAKKLARLSRKKNR